MERIAGTDLTLIRVDDRLELHEYPHQSKSRGVFVDFAKLVDRGSQLTSRKQPLARAIGSGTRTVVDTTAGLGQDSFLIACLGHDVTAIERNETLAALLENGIERALASDKIAPFIHNRLRTLHGDSVSVLPTLAAPEVVYMDPMYPPKRKSSALPKKSIRWIRELVGDDPDSEELFQVARSVATYRVVVKRPNHAPPIAGKPDVEYKSKLVRYDVYQGGRGS